MSAVLDVDAQIDAVVERSFSLLAPPPSLTVSEFADAHIILTSGPLAGARWKTDFAPYQRGIMDAVHEKGVQTVVVMGSSQWGKTSIAINMVAYHIAHDPCPILVVEPSVDPMGKDFAKNRLDPVISATPILDAKLPKKRVKDASNTTLHKTFAGGSLAIAGANSAASLAARPVRLLICDEIDRYPHELPGEGNTLSIAIKRTQTYRQRKRIVMLSSPTLIDAPIHSWFKRGDQRRYHVPCPGCGVLHPYRWMDVKWTDHDPATARLVCPDCGYAMGDAERVAMLSKGEWRADHPDRRDKAIVSFHLWEAYSPMSSLQEMVKGFLAAREKQKAGDRSEMHSWQNTTLGEPVEPDDGIGVEPHVLMLRREDYGGVLVPQGACCLTMGVDTQDDRLELVVVGWGPQFESWLVDRQTLPGDTSQPQPWAALSVALNTPYRHASGANLHIHATAVDSGGHRTAIVYDWVKRHEARNVYAIIGRDGQRPIMASPSPRRWGRDEREVPLYTVGTDAAKALLMSRLALTEKGPGYVHLPLTVWCDDEFCLQVTSERLVTKFHDGRPVSQWKKLRPRNEALDGMVYAMAALEWLHPQLDTMAANLAAIAARRTGGPEPPKPPPQRRTSRSSYLG